MGNQEKTFERLVAEYSQDMFADKDGVVGFVPRGFFPSDVEDTLYALEIGEHTDIVSFPDSFQIIKVLDKDEEQGMIKISRIYLEIKSLIQLLDEQMSQAEVKVYLN